MAIPEQQLETWSSQGAIAGSRDTYATVKLALEACDTEYASKNYQVFLQGSYCNDTNVYAESDVDIVICFKTVFYHDLSDMSQMEQNAFKAAHSDSSDNFSDFKAQVLRTLRKRFGNSVNPGSKAIKIPADRGRRNADVVVATDFRRYHRFSGLTDQIYDDGICFFTDTGQRIANYPKQHSANCTAKHKATEDRFKRAIRILKNIRQRLVDQGVIEKTLAPSYFLEGLLYNVPNECFGKTYQSTMLDSLRFVLNNDRSKFVSANREYYLLGNSAVLWPAENCQRFLDAVVKLWDEWK